MSSQSKVGRILREKAKKLSLPVECRKSIPAIGDRRRLGVTDIDAILRIEFAKLDMFSLVRKSVPFEEDAFDGLTLGVYRLYYLGDANNAPDYLFLGKDVYGHFEVKCRTSFNVDIDINLCQTLGSTKEYVPNLVVIEREYKTPLSIYVGILQASSVKTWPMTSTGKYRGVFSTWAMHCALVNTLFQITE